MNANAVVRAFSLRTAISNKKWAVELTSGTLTMPCSVSCREGGRRPSNDFAQGALSLSSPTASSSSSVASSCVISAARPQPGHAWRCQSRVLSARRARATLALVIAREWRAWRTSSLLYFLEAVCDRQTSMIGSCIPPIPATAFAPGGGGCGGALGCGLEIFGCDLYGGQ